MPASSRPAPNRRSITALAQGLVDGISKRDKAALAQLTCGKVASTLGSDSAGPDPTTFDHVDNIRVSPDGNTGYVDIYAYPVKKGPPASAVTFQVQKDGSAWKACDYNTK